MANSPVLMAFSVALLAIFDADEESIDQPQKSECLLQISYTPTVHVNYNQLS